jgi:DNA mismatch repair protein MutL
MNRIRLLSEHVANQIAAGEVVERPASVVKELVENALDAGASRIAVEVQAGGRSLIRVTDDGAGMSRDDALMAFERHATSKIRRAEDLLAISTMGFRGEALPSIASVSRLVLTTRERDSDAIEATQVIIQGGKILEVKSAAGAPGTTVEIRQIFFNLPARRKFLRSEETERAHIQHYLTLATVAHPQVGFTFTHDQRLIWQLPPVATSGTDGALGALRERLRALYGGELNLVPVDLTRAIEVYRRPDLDAVSDSAAPDEASGAALRVWGFIGAPGVSRTTREDQHLFVNRRPVENRALNHALLEGYHTALMKGRFPVAALFIEISPVLVDVNIHPAKREVKFREERQVRGIVTQAVRRALLGYHSFTAPEASPTSSAPQELPADKAPPGVLPGAEFPSPAVKAVPPDESAPIGTALLSVGLNRPASVARIPPPDSEPDHELSFAKPLAAEVTPPRIEPVPASLSGEGEASSSPSPPSRETPTVALPLLNIPLRLLGIIGRLYAVLESDRGLVLLDQHAAHERILFERMLQQLEHGAAPCQRLLLPETVELSPRDASFLHEQLSTLNRLGVSLREFGERTFLLDGLPPFVRVRGAREFVLELVDELRAVGQDVNALRLGEHTVAKTVCRHAVKANDPLATPELEKLVADLRHCTMPYTCPHGRPTLIELNWRELERKFGRAQ